MICTKMQTDKPFYTNLSISHVSIPIIKESTNVFPKLRVRSQSTPRPMVPTKKYNYSNDKISIAAHKTSENIPSRFHSDDSYFVNILLDEMEKNPTSKVCISIGQIHVNLSNEFVRSKLSSKQHNDFEEQCKPIKRTVFDIRGCGKIDEEFIQLSVTDN